MTSEDNFDFTDLRVYSGDPADPGIRINFINFINKQKIPDLGKGYIHVQHLTKKNEGHPLLGYDYGFNPVFIKDRKIILDKQILKLSFFIPTSGRGQLDDDGKYTLSHKFNDVQLDFLIKYFDHWGKEYKTTLLVDFFEESPQLAESAKQLYLLCQLYDVPRQFVKFIGFNFTGQSMLNDVAEELGEIPFHYIVNWDMHGHMDMSRVENNLIKKHHHTKLGFTPIELLDANDWETVRPNSICFLNRRPDPSRTILSWLLFCQGYHKYKTVTTLYPPLDFHLIGKQRKSSNAQTWLTKQYMEHTFKTQKFDKFITDYLTEETVDEFKNVFNVGKSREDDYDFIGGVESRHIPGEGSFYVWLTCESTGILAHNNYFITEKTLKPLMMGYATIVYSSQPGFLQGLKSLGFHTLAEEFGINETYDTVDNDLHRMELVATEVMKVCKKPPEELHQCYLSAKSKIIENQKRVASLLSMLNGYAYTKRGNYVQEQINSTPTTDELLDFKLNKIFKIYKDFYEFDF